ncbi:MAG TPA: hypothetical protein VGA17_07245 [Nitrospiraceae bacterium]|jgi:hypothetical protein
MSAQNANDLDLNSPESIHIILERHLGQRVTVNLVGGGELQGAVSKVGTTSLYITELTGREFFDAVVRLDHISAVVAKMRSK